MIEQWIHQLPNSWSGNLGLALIIVVSFYVLIRSADALVEGAVELANDLGIPKLIIGATIVSLGTTTPETAVSVMAALQNQPGLAIGNGVGSLIFDLAAILGASIIFARIPINERMVKRQSRIVLGSALLFCFFVYAFPDQYLQRWMGFVLVACFGLYMYSTFTWARRNRASGDSDLPAEAPAQSDVKPRSAAMALLVMFIGLCFLLLSSHVLIPSVELSAVRMGIPQAVIAATLVAIGTSLPEVMTALTSIRKGHPEIVLGNVLGADVLNLLFVIGVSASAVPLRLDPEFTLFQGPFMLALLIMFQFFVITTRGFFRRWQGIVMVASYVVFVLVSLFVLPRLWPVAGSG